MKTININLIGEFAKTVKSKRIELKEDTLDSRTRIFVIAFILGTFVILAGCFGTWLVVKMLSGKADKDLKQLKTELVQLQNEERILSDYTKEIKNKKKIAEFKLLARKQISSSFIPWSEILKDLATKVPKNIIITDIQKILAGKGSNLLTLSGIVSAKDTPLTEVSFLILNINQDEKSLLTEATIKELKYEKESDSYEFKIEANLRKSKQE